MKKVLLASTVLAMTATVAAADVTVSGTARMGVAYNSEAPNELGFTSRARVNFTMSGETDTGLSFGASFDAHDAGNANNGTGGDVNGEGSMSSGSVFISGAFGRLTMGDVAGAAEFVVGDLAGVGLTDLGDTNENIYLSNNGAFSRAAARYEYTSGALTFAVSADNPQFDSPLFENVYSVGVRYAVDSYSFALGYETSKILGVTVDHVIAAAEGTFSGVTVKATYGEASDVDFSQYGISARYSMDALALTAFHRVEDDAGAKDKFTGIGASYDLGGGASLVGGLVSVNPAVGSNETRADFGVSFSF